MLFSEKRPRLILGIVLICVLAGSAFVVINYLTTPAKPPTPHPLNPPIPAPAAVGCYQYRQTQGWVNVTCLPPGSVHGHPLEGGQGNGGSASPGIVGIASASPSSTSPPFVITRAEVEIAFKTESVELDSLLSQNQGGAFSIQLNTNLFTGSNGNQDAVQFTLIASHAPGNNSNVGSWGVCVWNVDVTKGGYTPQCDNSGLLAQVLSSSYSATIEGDIVSTNSGNLVRVTAFLPNGQILTASLPDTYNLAGNWLETTGTILGFLNGSQAIFSGPTVEDTYLFATSCAEGYTCNSPILNGEVYGYAGYPFPYGGGGTLESNDLSYTNPIPPDNSSLGCSNGQAQNGQCTLSTESCFMGGGTTCVTAPIPGFPLEGTIIGMVVGAIFIVISRSRSSRNQIGLRNASNR